MIRCPFELGSPFPAPEQIHEHSVLPEGEKKKGECQNLTLSCTFCVCGCGGCGGLFWVCWVGLWSELRCCGLHTSTKREGDC